MRYGFVNNFAQALAAPLAEGSTTLSLDGGGSLLSNAGADLGYTLTLFQVDDQGEETAREIVLVTGVSGNDLTIVGEQEGTVRPSGGWLAGTKVEARLTALGLISLDFRNASSIVLGEGAQNDATNCLAGGRYAYNGKSGSVAWGDGASTWGQYSASFGRNAATNADSALAGGSGALASGLASVAWGSGCQVSGDYSACFGGQGSVSGARGTAGGYTASVSAQWGAAYGYGSSVSGEHGLAMGHNAAVYQSEGIAAGNGASSNAGQAIAQGAGASAFGARGVATGAGAQAAEDSSAYGGGADASGGKSCAMGANSTAQPPQSSAFGADTISANVGQTLLGYGAGGSAVPGGLIVHGLAHLVSTPTHPADAAAPAITRQSAAQVVIATEPLNLTDDTAAVELALPSGALLFIDGFDVVVVGSDGAGGSPEISIGPNDVTPAEYLASTPVSLTAVGGRESHAPLVANGIASLRVATTVAGTGTTYQAKVVVRGYVMEL
ncbi:hypothetical protein [Billgrantia bachuensis]|uniref:Uncharacterized protein n=1 Tax=Billgrantia bachuensis TaxID=2717286 RepID=A0ABX0PPN4_9GAMM|nr:hypothetical protein [Halomonas bachuensis]NIC05272.1 hypothetical protein [Halomonas bachuensis]